MKYFIYARKSTDDEERQILSIDAQLDELRMLAAREKLEVVREYIESQTAKKPGRPIFNEMLKAIKRGEAQAILAWHPDRLARNSVDGGRLIYDLDTGQLATLKFPTTWFENTPQGKFMLSIAFGQSKYYVDSLSENIKRGLRKKLREGIYPNKPPIGYLNDPKTRAVYIDPERGPLVRRMFEEYATGRYTAAALLDLVTAWGLRSFNGLTLPLSKMLWTLDHIFYTGVFRFNGEVYEGKHPPLISRELFERVQELSAKRLAGPLCQAHRFPLRATARCRRLPIHRRVQKGSRILPLRERRAAIQDYPGEAFAQAIRTDVHGLASRRLGGKDAGRGGKGEGGRPREASGPGRAAESAAGRAWHSLGSAFGCLPRGRHRAGRIHRPQGKIYSGESGAGRCGRKIRDEKRESVRTCDRLSKGVASGEIRRAI